MKIISAIAINDLVSKFSAKTLPKSEWDHRAHIIVAIWHNMNFEFEEALDLVRSKIKAYNLAVGTLNTDNAGYHETLTVFWMALTKSFLQQHPSNQIEEICNDFLRSEYAAKSYPLNYYTREHLFSVAARKEWVDGDIKPVSFLQSNNS